MAAHSDWTKRIAAALDRLLDADEVILAEGRADDLESLGEVPAGHGYTFVRVTSGRLLWIGGVRLKDVATLDFGDISSFAEGRYQHRYVLLLRHPPARRVEMQPRLKLLGLELFGNAYRPVWREETIFEFSRAETAAAKATRDQLAQLGVRRGEPLRLPTPLPREGAKRLLMRL